MESDNRESLDIRWFVSERNSWYKFFDVIKHAATILEDFLEKKKILRNKDMKFKKVFINKDLTYEERKERREKKFARERTYDNYKTYFGPPPLSV